jgi:hypothetical protein
MLQNQKARTTNATGAGNKHERKIVKKQQITDITNIAKSKPKVSLTTERNSQKEKTIAKHNSIVYNCAFLMARRTTKNFFQVAL